MQARPWLKERWSRQAWLSPTSSTRKAFLERLSELMTAPNTFLRTADGRRRRRTSNVRLPLELRSDRHETSATRVSDDLQISIFRRRKIFFGKIFAKFCWFFVIFGRFWADFWFFDVKISFYIKFCFRYTLPEVCTTKNRFGRFGIPFGSIDIASVGRGGPPWYVRMYTRTYVQTYVRTYAWSIDPFNESLINQ